MHKFNKSLAALAISAAMGMSLPAIAASEALLGSINVSDTAGLTVTAKDPLTGASRTIAVNADGSFRFAKMEAGNYVVTVYKNGNKVAEQENVRVSLGSNAFAEFDLNRNIESIEIRGARLSNIDLSTTDSGLNIGESEIDAMPIARTMTGVALLAPGTVPGDSGWGNNNTTSFGGSSVSENACYINGLEVTNTRNGLGCGGVPFEFYKEFQVKTGGYSAYYGRATGGTINAITKSGSNDWEFGFTTQWRPGKLEEEGKVSRGEGGLGNIFSDERVESTNDFEYSFSAAGPIIEDKLFIYALINPRDTEYTFATTSETDLAYSPIDRIYERSADGGDNLFWGVKLDWDITENHRLSYFAYSDRVDITEDRWVYDPNQQAKVLQTQNENGLVGRELRFRGGEAQSISYTGFLTDDLSVSALWGEVDTQYRNQNLFADDNCPSVAVPEQSDQYTPEINAQLATISRCGDGLNRSSGNEDSNTQYRFDVEYIWGDHNLKFGLDVQDRSTFRDQFRIGGHAYTYVVLNADHENNPTGEQVLAVTDRVFEGGGSFEAELEAFYIEDQWQFNDNLMLSIGLRKDKFEGTGVTGRVLYSFSTDVAPRLGFTWDVMGDGESKLYGTYGEYYLPIANNTIYRIAAGISDATTTYLFDGVNPSNGVPLNLVQTDRDVHAAGASPSKDVYQTQEADPFARDEWILGYETAFSDDLSLGVKGIYREVTSALDDYCGAYAWPHCLMINPGKSATAYKDNVYYYGPGDPRNNHHSPEAWDPNLIDGLPDPGSLTTTSAEQIRLPAGRNEYTAVQLSAKYRTENLQVDFLYTWSRSVGNFEGAVKSDINQADAGITQDFDFPALMDGADGYQANDRRHVFKVFGNYRLTDDLWLGFNSFLKQRQAEKCLRCRLLAGSQ